MECESYNSLLSAYADGALRPREAARVRRHLDGCRRCREDLAEIQTLRSLLRALPRPSPRPSFWSDAHRAVRQHARPRRRVRVPMLPHHGWAVATGAVILALLMSAPRPVDHGIDTSAVLPAIGAPEPGAVVSPDTLVALHASVSAREPLSDAAALHYSSGGPRALEWADAKQLDSD